MTSISDYLASKKQYSISYKNRYFLTIRKFDTYGYVSKLDLMEVIWALKLKIDDLRILHHTFETGSHRQLHFHAMVTTDIPVVYKTNSRAGQFRVYWEKSKLRDFDNLWDYINKYHWNRKELQQAIFAANYYNNIYIPRRGETGGSGADALAKLEQQEAGPQRVEPT